MKIFLRRLPQGVTPGEIHEFVTEAITPPWYRPFALRGTVKSHVVLRIKDLDLDTVEYHGLLDIQPIKTALAALPVLNQLRFKERSVEARKWQDRTEQRERRNPYQVAPAGGRNQRRGDRRREHLVIDTIEPYEAPKFLGLKDFHREFGK